MAKATEMQAATPTLPSTNTPELTATDVQLTNIPEPISTPEPIIVYEFISPDSKWRAKTNRVFVEGEERSILVVTNLDEGRIWEIENEPFVERPPEGFWFPVPFHWSKDGNYLYYLRRASGDGCFGGNEYMGKDLKKFDLVSGESGDVSSGGHYLSFSPDEKFLAIVPFGWDGIQIQELESGEFKKFVFPIRREDVGIEIMPGYLTWSPDSVSVIYVIMAGVCGGSVESQYNWIVRLDVHASSQRVLVEKDERGFVPVSWIEKDKVHVRDHDGRLWFMNPHTGKISVEE